MTKRQNRVWAELKMPTRIADYIVRVGAIIRAADGNPQLPGVDVILVPLKAACADLQSAQVVAQTLTKGKPAERDSKMQVVRGLLDEYRTFVQKIADAHLEEAASIIENAGLSDPAASFVNGAVITVDGGMTAQA